MLKPGGLLVLANANYTLTQSRLMRFFDLIADPALRDPRTGLETRRPMERCSSRLQGKTPALGSEQTAFSESAPNPGPTLRTSPCGWSRRIMHRTRDDLDQLSKLKARTIRKEDRYCGENRLAIRRLEKKLPGPKPGERTVSRPIRTARLSSKTGQVPWDCCRTGCRRTSR